ncbi:MAG: helix-turn-helix domain-containing protein [Longibaculum sp.]
MDLGKIIAFNLKKLRNERHLSLGQLAIESGISKTMLSDIEKGNSNPTINTIWKIANGLKVPYTKLIDGVDDETTIIQRKETIKQTGETKSYRVYCYFTTTPTRNFELFYCELDPLSSNQSIGHSKNAQEYIYVIDGELTLDTDNGEYVLCVGDSLAFDSSMNHTYKNSQEKMTTFIVINYYPI